MGAEIRGDPGGRRLNSWKEIAGFFGCDERTVKRWEADRGLPVRRLPNGSRSGVFAYENELREWLNRGDKEPSPRIVAEASSPLPPKPSRGRRPAVVALAVAGAIVTVTLLLWQSLELAHRPKAAAGAPTAASHVPNRTAQAFYRAGLYAWQTRTPVGLTHAVDDFTQAIVHDPEYAQAYAGLASCYNLLREYTTMAPDYAFPRAKAAAERAIALDPSLADAHASLAFVDFYWLRNAGSARREFEHAIALSPNNAVAHHWYATFLMTIGDSGDALTEIERAEALDTESTAIRADKGFILFYGGHANDAVALLQQLEQTQPLFASPHHYLAVIYRARGDDPGFLRELSASANARGDDADKIIADAATKALAAGGHTAMLASMLDQQRRLFSEHKLSAYALAETYADLGDTANALFYLRESVDRRELDNITLAIEPQFRDLRGDARFGQLASEIFKAN